MILEVVRGELAREAAVVLISESEEELALSCDRILVFFKGRVVEVLERGSPAFSVRRIYELSQGVWSA
jgi:ABC-type sugar transport system ATPase subunit